AVIIMMEMTADRTMILPLFGTAIIADSVSAAICRPKLYHALSAQFRSAATSDTQETSAENNRGRAND
ncbi:MAG: hypothetical protein ABI395_12045, partial [Sphingobium sp.]